MSENPNIPETKKKTLEQLIQGVHELSFSPSQEKQGTQDPGETTSSIIEEQITVFRAYASFRSDVKRDYLNQVASALGLTAATTGTDSDKPQGIKDAQKAGEVAKRLEALKVSYTQYPNDAQALENFLEVKKKSLMDELQEKIEELTKNPDYTQLSKSLSEYKTAVPLLEEKGLAASSKVIRNHAEIERRKLRLMLERPSNIINELERIKLAIGHVQQCIIASQH